MPEIDKARFIQEAPAFYALAIGWGLVWKEPFDPTSGAISQRELDDVFDTKILVFRHDALFKAGLKILVDAGFVKVKTLTFGPPLFAKTDLLGIAWNEDARLAKYPVFAEYSGITDRGWLLSAIEDVNDQFYKFNITEADFEAASDLWEPLPLDRADPEVAEVAKAVGDASEHIEASNGYAESAPGERDYVVQSLKSFRTTLRESAQITAMQIKTFAIDPLTAVIARFGQSATGVVATAAKAAVVSWLTAKFGQLIAGLLF